VINMSQYHMIGLKLVGIRGSSLLYPLHVPLKDKRNGQVSSIAPRKCSDQLIQNNSEYRCIINLESQEDVLFSANNG